MTRPSGKAKLAVPAAILVALAGCGSATDAAPGEDYAVAVERVAFPSSQRLAEAVAFVLRVRNTGDRTIPNIVVTLRGFNDGSDRDLWLVDEPPPGSTASDDTWSAGPLKPGARTTLRWEVTPVSAGTHELTYAVAGGLSGDDGASLRGEPGGRLTVRVREDPADARVDPQSGRVLRE